MAKPKKVGSKGHSGLIIGLILISFGLIFLLSDMNVLTFNPMYITLILGLVFLAVYYLYRIWAFLIPGVILTLISLLIISGLEELWYSYTIIVGLSFLAVYLTRMEKTNWAIIPAIILITVGLMNAFDYYLNVSSWPIIIILLGVYLLYKNYKK